MSRTRFGIAVLLFVFFPSIVWACLWDYDTLRAERARFPGTLELITGKFLRHSADFYQWRIQDRLSKLANHPVDKFALWDDLAVAYEKTGEHDLAVRTMLASLAEKPDRYQTHANLGTFYMQAGDMEKGLKHVEKALAINPDAHFGREKYQKYLAQYVMGKQKRGRELLPLAENTGSKINFYHFLNPPTDDGRRTSEQAALKGVQGMMRFAKYDSPILLEVLGDLLLLGNGHDRQDAKQLAGRAYLKASYGVLDSRQQQAYRTLARNALAMQRRGPDSNESVGLGEVEQAFRAELESAQSWYDQLCAKERGWIRDGKNPEVEFDALYKEEPSVDSPEDPTILRVAVKHLHPLSVGLLLGASLVLFAYLLQFTEKLWRKHRIGSASVSERIT